MQTYIIDYNFINIKTVCSWSVVQYFL